MPLGLRLVLAQRVWIPVQGGAARRPEGHTTARLTAIQVE